MKFFNVIICSFAISQMHAAWSDDSEVNCLPNNKVCVGDELINEHAKDSRKLFYKVTKIKKETRQSFSSDLYRFQFSYPNGESEEKTLLSTVEFVKKSSMPSCVLLNGINYCLGQKALFTTGAFVGKDAGLIKARVKALTNRSHIIAEDENGKLISSYQYPYQVINEGAVPGFPSIILGEEIPNAFGSNDIVKYRFTDGRRIDYYFVYLGDLNEHHVFNELNFKKRMSGKTEVEMEGIAYAYLKSTPFWTKRNAAEIEYKVLEQIDAKCAEIFPGGYGEVVNADLHVKKKELILPGFTGFNYPFTIITGIKIEFGIHGDFDYKATCRHTLGN